MLIFGLACAHATEPKVPKQIIPSTRYKYISRLVLAFGGSMVRFISNIKKDYGSMFRVVIYHEPKRLLVSDNTIKRNKLQVSDDYEPSISSLRRTKATIRDIVLANDFDLFVTFTFDPDKVNRFSYDSCLNKLTRWVHNQHDKSPDFIYLFIPEQHKSGAWHFHGFMGHFNGSMRYSGHKSSYGAKIYNITAYRGGFTTACYFDNKDVAVNYISKYITKDFIRKFNQRRFFCSKNLVRPVKTVNASIDFTLPHRVISASDDSVSYEFPLAGS